MRIYRRVEIDMASGRVLRAESQLWRGDAALCKGGGPSSTVNSVDYAYNDRMATLSEEQQKWAREYFDMWKQSFKPLEIAQAQANLALLPQETELYRKQLAAAQELLPQETELYRQQLSAAKTLLPQQTRATGAFLNAALQGVDVNERMAMATADAASAWKDAQAQAARANARMGVNPNSGRFQGVNAALDTQKAAQIAGARTQARVGAEQENFERLKAAAGVNGMGSVMQGGNFGGLSNLLRGIGSLSS